MITVSHSGETKASRQQLIDVVLAPELVAEIAGSKVESADPAWPQVGSTLTFKAMGMKMVARLTEHRPDEIVMSMQTPGSPSTVRHRFTALPNGGTRMEKIVELQDGFLNRLLAALMLRRQLKRETDKTIQMADEVAAGRRQVSRPSAG